MKKLITLSIITLFLISCSSDDEFVDPIDDKKSLIEVVQKRFDNDILKERIVFEYNDNKPQIASFYNSNDELAGNTEFFYNSKKLLFGTKSFFPAGTLTSQTTLIYDSVNRIIQKETSEKDGKYISVNKFTHNDDNTITVNAISGTYETTKTFHINADGLIFKETVNGQITIEVIYEGNNPVSSSSNSKTTYFSYDDLNLPKGVFLNLNKNTFGENKINPILQGYYLEDQLGSSADKYKIKTEFSNGHIEENKYIFDSEGYPLSMKRYYNDELTDEMEYVYD